MLRASFRCRPSLLHLRLESWQRKATWTDIIRPTTCHTLCLSTPNSTRKPWNVFILVSTASTAAPRFEESISYTILLLPKETAKTFQCESQSVRHRHRAVGTVFRVSAKDGQEGQEGQDAPNACSMDPSSSPQPVRTSSPSNFCPNASSLQSAHDKTSSRNHVSHRFLGRRRGGGSRVSYRLPAVGEFVGGFLGLG